MQIERFEKNVSYTDREMAILTKKLNSLATHCKRLKDESSVIRVEAERRDTKKKDDEVKVMLTVQLPGKAFRAESRKERILEAFDRALEKLEPQLMKYKEKRDGKARAKRANKFRSMELAV